LSTRLVYAARSPRCAAMIVAVVMLISVPNRGWR
jgi:hypothetical protein